MPPWYARTRYFNHAVFEHEYDSLSDDEKRIFIRLLDVTIRTCLTG